MSYLDLVHLDKSYDGTVAVRDFNLSVEKGEFVSLLGPSGCGKTTTLRMIAGFETPDNGSIILSGQEITSIPSNQRGMGMVFQSYALFPNMTAWNNIAFGLRVSRLASAEIKNRVNELLDLVGLGNEGHKFASELSGGQQQRVALARALAIEPRVLLLDEPLSALDAVVRVALRNEIRRIQSALGITTIYVTHDQEEALSISDRVVVMRQAVIEQEGTPEEIYIHPQTYFVATFVGTINQFLGTLADNKKGLVTCCGGELQLAVPPASVSGIPQGEEITVFVRPEEILVSKVGDKAKPGNTYQAVLKSITLLGPVTRLNLDYHGQSIFTDIRTIDRHRFVLDQPVQLSFTPDSCRCMTAEDIQGNDNAIDGIKEVKG
jgi:putative spermidine/putrescine transport system ATP-binding protein